MRMLIPAIVAACFYWLAWPIALYVAATSTGPAQAFAAEAMRILALVGLCVLVAGIAILFASMMFRCRRKPRRRTPAIQR